LYLDHGMVGGFIHMLNNQSTQHYGGVQTVCSIDLLKIFDDPSDNDHQDDSRMDKGYYHICGRIVFSENGSCTFKTRNDLITIYQRDHTSPQVKRTFKKDGFPGYKVFNEVIAKELFSGYSIPSKWLPFPPAYTACEFKVSSVERKVLQKVTQWIFKRSSSSNPALPKSESAFYASIKQLCNAPALVLPVHYVIYQLQHEGFISINSEGLVALTVPKTFSVASYLAKLEPTPVVDDYDDDSFYRDQQVQKTTLRRCLEWTVNWTQNKNASYPATFDGLFNSLLELCFTRVAVNPRVIMQHLVLKNVLSVNENGRMEYKK